MFHFFSMLFLDFVKKQHRKEMKHLIPPHHRKVPSLLLVQRNRLCHSRFASREQLVNFETTKRSMFDKRGVVTSSFFEENRSSPYLSTHLGLAVVVVVVVVLMVNCSCP